MGWRVLDQEVDILAAHAALLHTNKILLFSGNQFSPFNNVTGNTDNSPLFDIALLSLSRIPSPDADMFCCGHAMLGNGSLLVAGGTQRFPSNTQNDIHKQHFGGIHDAFTFDPETETWRRVAPMRHRSGRNDGGGRWYPTLLTLPSGNILAMSGHPNLEDDRHSNNSPEIYSANTNAWRLCDEDLDLADYPRLHVLKKGLVFSATPTSGECRLFNPTEGKWDTNLAFDPPPPEDDKIYFGLFGSSVLLPLLRKNDFASNVLILGGRQPFVIHLNSTNPLWRPTSPRTLPNTPPRYQVNSVILPTGQIFVCGGVSKSHEERKDDSDNFAVRTAELYDPELDRWSALETATVTRNYHSVSLLMPDGAVWTCGSNKNAKVSFLDAVHEELVSEGPLPEFGPDPISHTDTREKRIEIYQPSYFAALRPSILSMATNVVSYGQTFQVKTTDASIIHRVAIIRIGSVTHSYNSDQRYVETTLRQRQEANAHSGGTIRS